MAEILIGSIKKGEAEGVAELDASGRVPVSQLPSYVDDVLEFANLAALPATGEVGKIYIATDTNKTYRWSGAGYAEISSSLALGTTSATAFRGDHGQIAYTHSQAQGNPHNLKASDVIKAGTNVQLATDGTVSATDTKYTLPPATDTTLGGVKAGSGITAAADGTISADIGTLEGVVPVTKGGTGVTTQLEATKNLVKVDGTSITINAEGVISALSKRRADTLYANALIGNAQGNMVQVEDAWEADAIGVTISGKSVQDGTPTPDAPVPIVNVTSPVRIRADDFIFHVEHSGGLFDWSITNADNLTWYFPDGTTSTEARPSRTIDAGTVKVVCDDWTKGSIQINDNDTNSAFIGDLSDLPRVTYYLSMVNCSNLTGNISDLPRVTNYLSMVNCSNLTGNISDLPRVTNYLSMVNCSNLTGNISDLPRVTNTLSLYNCSKLTGDISDLPPVTNYLDLGYCSKLTGDIADLPPVTNYLVLYYCSKLTGDISDLPPVTNFLSIGNCSLLTGVLSAAGTAKEIYLQGTGMSASDTDQTLINLAATTTVTSGGVLKIKKNRTSASDAAFAYLSSRFAITEV